jgi:hypothetical protein
MVAPTTSKEIPCLNKFPLSKFIINTSFLSPFPHQIYDLVGSPIKNFVFEIISFFLQLCALQVQPQALYAYARFQAP